MIYITVSQPCLNVRQKHKGLYLAESKKGLFVLGLIFSQSLIVYVKMGLIDWVEISLGQIVLPCFQPDIRVSRNVKEKNYVLNPYIDHILQRRVADSYNPKNNLMQ